jgi:hypothetical protein
VACEVEDGDGHRDLQEHAGDHEGGLRRHASGQSAEFNDCDHGELGDHELGEVNAGQAAESTAGEHDRQKSQRPHQERPGRDRDEWEVLAVYVGSDAVVSVGVSTKRAHY